MQIWMLVDADVGANVGANVGQQKGEANMTGDTNKRVDKIFNTPPRTKKHLR